MSVREFIEKLTLLNRAWRADQLTRKEWRERLAVLSVEYIASAVPVPA